MGNGVTGNIMTAHDVAQAVIHDEQPTSKTAGKGLLSTVKAGGQVPQAVILDEDLFGKMLTTKRQVWMVEKTTELVSQRAQQIATATGTDLSVVLEGFGEHISKNAQAMASGEYDFTASVDEIEADEDKDPGIKDWWSQKVEEFKTAIYEYLNIDKYINIWAKIKSAVSDFDTAVTKYIGEHKKLVIGGVSTAILLLIMQEPIKAGFANLKYHLTNKSEAAYNASLLAKDGIILLDDYSDALANVPSSPYGLVSVQGDMPVCKIQSVGNSFAVNGVNPALGLTTQSIFAINKTLESIKDYRSLILKVARTGTEYEVEMQDVMVKTSGIGKVFDFIQPDIFEADLILTRNDIDALLIIERAVARLGKW